MTQDQSASRSDDADDGIAALERLKANFCWSDSRDAGTAFQKAKDCFARAIDTEIEYLRTVARSEQQPTFEPELRALLAGLECQNVDELMSASKNRVMLCRFLGERIACAAKAGAHLQPIFGATPNER